MEGFAVIKERSFLKKFLHNLKNASTEFAKREDHIFLKNKEN